MRDGGNATSFLIGWVHTKSDSCIKFEMKFWLVNYMSHDKLTAYPSNLSYKSHQITELICFSSRLLVVCPSRVLSREWRCSWNSADRRCSNYIWVINNFITYYGAPYIRGLKVLKIISGIICNPQQFNYIQYESRVHAHQIYIQYVHAYLHAYARFSHQYCTRLWQSFLSKMVTVTIHWSVGNLFSRNIHLTRKC